MSEETGSGDYLQILRYTSLQGAFSDPEQVLAGYFASPTVGLAILDHDLRYLAVNQALAEMNGVPAVEHLGKTVQQVLGDVAEQLEPAFKRVLARGEVVLNHQLQAKLPAREKPTSWLEHFFPIKDRAGDVQRIGAVILELTNAQITLHQKQDQLDQKQLVLGEKQRELETAHSSLQAQNLRLETLLAINASLICNFDVPTLFPVISDFIRHVIHYDLASITLFDEESKSLRVFACDHCDDTELLRSGMEVPLKGSTSGKVFLSRQPRIFTALEMEQFEWTRRLLAHGIRSLCCMPLVGRKGCIGTLNLSSASENALTPQDLALLTQVAAPIAIAIDNARAYDEIARLKDKLAAEKLYLQQEVHSVLNFEEIVGESPALQRVLEQAKTVAPSDASVLVLGETGTGKDLLARAIHRMSNRKDASFIKLNCAAIPTGLLESELFGHEKGAFTGAISQKIGRLELADKGTLFLDEVGEIPLELQPKLLRVLQDQEFERLGSTRTIKVNVRLVTATNRHLEEAVSQKQFRSDLFYRLNVFPIRMPSLRERKKDIPLLISYFVDKFARRMNKRIDSVPSESMDALIAWDWPGNVRELENFVERSVILSGSSILNVPLTELRETRGTDSTKLVDMEREHILRVLRETGGIISGINGAATRLGMKRSTLQSRIQRMGISPKEYQS